MRWVLATLAYAFFFGGVIGAVSTWNRSIGNGGVQSAQAGIRLLDPWLGLIAAGGVLFTCSEVLAYIQRRTKRMEAEDAQMASRARAEKYAAQVAEHQASRGEQ